MVGIDFDHFDPLSSALSSEINTPVKQFSLHTWMFTLDQKYIACNVLYYVVITFTTSQTDPIICVFIRLGCNFSPFPSSAFSLSFLLRPRSVFPAGYSVAGGEFSGDDEEGESHIYST